MRSLALIPAAVLAACGGEPSFDERYDGAEQEIRARERELEAELDETGGEPAGASAARDRQ